MNVLKALTAILLMAASAWSQPQIDQPQIDQPQIDQPQIHLKSGLGKHAFASTRGNHYVLHFDSYPGPELRDELASRGIRVLQYVPDNALMVSSKASADLSGLPLLGAGSLDSSDKISPLLANQVAGAILAIFHPDVNPLRAREIAQSLGFLTVSTAGLLPNQFVLAGPIGRLSALAAFDEVAYLLPASGDLAAGVTVAGCAGAVTEAGSVGEYSLVGKGWPKDAGGKVALQYFIRSLTDKIEPSIARAEIERALREWTRYAALSVTPGQPGGPRTIDILFGRGPHGDQYPFDGPGGTLAHTFYPAPPNPEPIAGDMHLDADEPWRTGASIDLYSVALHEAGHALGLGHSDRPGSVMYPYYRQVSGLADDDIAAIRALYGAASATPPPITPPALPPATPVQPAASPAGDTQAPTVQIKSPGFTIVSTNGPSIAISGLAADNVAVTSVKWTNSSGGSGTASGTAAWSGTVPLLMGTNVITIRAYDAAGNTGWRSVTVVRR
jgi:hypothetical protein